MFLKEIIPEAKETVSRLFKGDKILCKVCKMNFANVTIQRKYGKLVLQKEV